MEGILLIDDVSWLSGKQRMKGATLKMPPDAYGDRMMTRDSIVNVE